MHDIGGIGSRVLAARQRLDWTREALAFHAGISWSAVAQVETGRRTNLRPGTLAALSRSLGVSIDYLVDGHRLPPTMLNHTEFPYRTDDQFQTTMGSFLGEGVERAEAVLAVTTLSNIELLREHLGQDAGKVEFVNSSQLLTTPIAALEAFRTFSKANLERGVAWIRVLGEPRWAERSEADVRLWARFESLINLLFAASPLTISCPYDERSLAPEILRQAHLTHPGMVGPEGVSHSPDFTDPGHFTLEPDPPGAL